MEDHLCTFAWGYHPVINLSYQRKCKASSLYRTRLCKGWATFNTQVSPIIELLHCYGVGHWTLDTISEVYRKLQGERTVIRVMVNLQWTLHKTTTALTIRAEINLCSAVTGTYVCGSFQVPGTIALHSTGIVVIQFHGTMQDNIQVHWARYVGHAYGALSIITS